jgi:hypothetical protein
MGEVEIFNLLAIIGAIAFSIGGAWFEDNRRRKRRRAELEEWVAREDAEKAANPPPPKPATPTEATLPQEPIIVKHTTPADPTLAEYMDDLPRDIKTISDVRLLAAKLEKEAKPGLWQVAIMKVVEQLQSNEKLYVMTWNAHCITTSRVKGQKQKHYQESHGVMFFSNRRFFYYRDPDPAGWIQFPLSDIYTVAAHKGNYFDGISFRTPSLNVELSFMGKIDRKLFRDMVVHLAANAACPSFTEGVSASELVPQVCECPGCGATVIIHFNSENRCEYCYRHVERQSRTPAQTTSTTPSLADELDRYKSLLDNGTISEEEFEAIKAKLLNSL